MRSVTLFLRLRTPFFCRVNGPHGYKAPKHGSVHVSKKHHTYSKQGQNYEVRTPFLPTVSVPNFFVVKTDYLLAAKGLGFTVTVKNSKLTIETETLLGP